MRSLPFFILFFFTGHQLFAQDYKIIDRDSFSLHYPSSWKLDTKSKDYEPDSTFTINAPGKLNNVIFFIKYQNINIENALDYMTILTTSTFRIKKTESIEITNWGNLSGKGTVIKGKEMGSDIIIKLFVYSEMNRALSVMEIYRDGKIDKLKEEFNSIALSFKFKGQN